jgi:hypothetical protein
MRLDREDHQALILNRIEDLPAYNSGSRPTYALGDE